jgi:hypothetical protein
MTLAANLELIDDVVAVGVLLDQGVDLGVGDGVYDCDEVVDSPGVDRYAEADLGIDLVTLGDGDVAHVVAEPGQLERTEGGEAAGGALPSGDPGRHPLIGDVADHSLAGHAGAGLDVAELPVAVCGLVQVHEVHVDLGPRQPRVRLGVQVQQRNLQGGQPADPHLGRGKGVHPGDQADAVRVGVGPQHH